MADVLGPIWEAILNILAPDRSSRGAESSEKANWRPFWIYVTFVSVAGTIGLVAYFIWKARFPKGTVTPYTHATPPGYCSIADDKQCEAANARCVVQYGYPTCRCLHPDHFYYHDRNLCTYRCRRELTNFCPNGVCLEHECFPDLYAFAGAIYGRRCEKSEPVDKCNVTCRELVSLACPHPRAVLRFCNGSHPPESLVEFACQNGTSERFRELTREEFDACVRHLHCRPLLAIYPCLAGYVANGSVVCNNTCVPSKDPDMKTLSLYGYCIWKQANCKTSMTNLLSALSNHSIGYSYTTDSFKTDKNLPVELLTTFTDTRTLKYQLMLAYGQLIQSKKLPYTPFSDNYTLKQFFRPDYFDKQVPRLRSLYSKDTDLISRLRAISEQYLDSEPVGSNPLTHTAYLDLLTNCSVFDDCPPTAFQHLNEMIRAWGSHAAYNCAIARVLYVLNLDISSAWYRNIAAMRSIDFATDLVSALYRRSFLAEVIDKARKLNRLASLDQDAFDAAMGLCDAKDNSTRDDANIVVPLTLVNGMSAPEGVTGYALVLASAESVKRVLCQETEPLPSVNCEINIYYAFAAFMPPPTAAESRLIDSNEKSLIYLTLRAAMRQQIMHGTRPASENFTEDRTSSVARIRDAARSVAEECLGTAS